MEVRGHNLKPATEQVVDQGCREPSVDFVKDDLTIVFDGLFTGCARKYCSVGDTKK